MKRFLVIIAAAGLMAGMSAANAAPFYKVQCYDANDKLVNCNNVGKVKKHAKKNTKSKIAKVNGKKANALAEKKAREKAIALRKLAKQNAELKAEMQALRKANLLAAAKTEEKPADTAQLAATATVAVPAPTATPTVTTQIAKEEPTKEAPSPWSFEVADWVKQAFNDPSGTTVKQPLNNELDLSLGYTITPHISVAIEQDIDWEWTNPNNDNNNGFGLEDLQLIGNFEDLYHSESKLTTLRGDITAWIGTSSASRTNGQILAPRFRAQIKTAFNDSKTWFRFDPYMIPYFNRYTTKPPSSSDEYSDTMADGNEYEILTPNSRFESGLKVVFHQRISERFSFEAYIKYREVYTYSDSTIINGQNQILADASWRGNMEVALPKFIVQATDAFTIEAWLQGNSDTQHFKLFATDSYNTLQIVVHLVYDI